MSIFKVSTADLKVSEMYLTSKINNMTGIRRLKAKIKLMLVQTILYRKWK